MTIIKLIIFILLSFSVLPQIPEPVDNPNEFGMSYICSYRFLKKEELKTMILNVRNGDSKSAYALFFSQSMIPYKNLLPDESELHLMLLKNGNPFGAMISGFKELDKNNYQKGIAWLEIAAEYGIIEAINYMHIIYNGKKYPELKNRRLELYWLKRLALSGNIYNLKKYIHNNPQNLNIGELQNWIDSYKALIKSHDFETVYKNKSIETLWILFQIEKNRKKVQNTLNLHHDWYGGLQYCVK